MIFKIRGEVVPTGSTAVNLRCPVCRRLGTFTWIGSNQDAYVLGALKEDAQCATYFGQRCCPNQECRAHIFIAYDIKGVIFASYPPERIDFDATDLPKPIVSALEEAITCHANECYVAAAMMVRKPLELLCEDHGAQGKNLMERIKTLRTKVLLPQELLDGLS